MPAGADLAVPPSEAAPLSAADTAEAIDVGEPGPTDKPAAAVPDGQPAAAASPEAPGSAATGAGPGSSTPLRPETDSASAPAVASASAPDAAQNSDECREPMSIAAENASGTPGCPLGVSEAAQARTTPSQAEDTAATPGKRVEPAPGPDSAELHLAGSKGGPGVFLCVARCAASPLKKAVATHCA